MTAARERAGTLAPPARAGVAAPERLTRPVVAWSVALLAAFAAAALIARDAGVAGPGAAPDVLRALAASVLVFAACGYAPARLLVPAGLAAYRPLVVLPLGAVTCGLALTLLGFAAVPFKVALGAVLAIGALSAIAARRLPAPEGDREPGGRLALLALGTVAVLVVALALVPTFRSGFVTVTGFGADAHQVTGSATLLQHAYPSSVSEEYPIDRVQVTWRSKYPIYYALAAVSTVSGLEPFEALMAVSALLLALSGFGFFLLARSTLRTGVGAAAVVMAIAVLDRQVFHLALHPYYNQLWGLLTLPFSIVLADHFVRDRAAHTLVLFALFTALGAFAYPLMLPFPLLALAGFYLWDRRARRARGEPVESLDPRRLWRGWRSLIWMIPVGLLLLVPIRGVVEKLADGFSVIANPAASLYAWQGDLQHYPPIGEFFGIWDQPLADIALLAVLGLAGWFLLRRAPRGAGAPLAIVLGLALIAGYYFHEVQYGQYFYFKILSFTGPLVLVAAVAGIAALAAGRGRTATLAAAAAVGALALSTLLTARDEIGVSFDQLTPETLELRDWSARLPPGASVRLDTEPADHLWQAYMLSDRPLGSRNPIYNFPHVAGTHGADHALDAVLTPPPRAAARGPDGRLEPPLFRNAELRLWKLENAGRDTTSRRLTPTATEITLGG